MWNTPGWKWGKPLDDLMATSSLDCWDSKMSVGGVLSPSNETYFVGNKHSPNPERGGFHFVYSKNMHPIILLLSMGK